MELVKGRRLNDRFQVIGSLGMDADGRVLLVRDAKFQDAIVALKVISSISSISQAILKDFNDRVELLNGVDPTHFNKPLELVFEQGFCGIVREHFEGEDLAAAMTNTSFSQDRCLKVLEEVLSGIE